MKAAVLYRGNTQPGYEEIEKPEPKGEDEVTVTMKAVAIKHFDKSPGGGQALFLN